MRRFVPVVDRPGVREREPGAVASSSSVQSKRAIENIRRTAPGSTSSGPQPREEGRSRRNRRREIIPGSVGIRASRSARQRKDVRGLDSAGLRDVSVRRPVATEGRESRSLPDHGIEQSLGFSPARRQSAGDLGTRAIEVPQQLGPFLRILFGKVCKILFRDQCLRLLERLVRSSVGAVLSAAFPDRNGDRQPIDSTAFRCQYARLPRAPAPCSSFR